MRGRPLKTSTVWKLVREEILFGHQQNLCGALRQLEAAKKITYDRRSALLLVIADLLNGHVSYEAWIQGMHPRVHAATPVKDMIYRAQQGRLAWLDHLIAECKARGN